MREFLLRIFGLHAYVHNLLELNDTITNELMQKSRLVNELQDELHHHRENEKRLYNYNCELERMNKKLSEDLTLQQCQDLKS